MADIPPSQTIYINNLYEKLNKEELKKCLYAMFSQFGKILDVVSLKAFRLRGQAWVVFGDIPSATNALRSMQGFPFFDKPIKITYAKTESDAVAKLKGTFKPDYKRSKKNAQARDELLKRKDDKTRTSSAPGQAGPAKGSSDSNAAPNKILFVQNLPEKANERMVSMLFQQFHGFTEVRMPEARPGLAFVEYENDMQASAAMTSLQGFKIDEAHAIQISYARQGK